MTLDIRNPEYQPLKLYKLTPERDSLVTYFLQQSEGCPHRALAAACAVIEIMARGMSSGFARLPPRHQTLPPKSVKPTILTTGEQDD